MIFIFIKIKFHINFIYEKIFRMTSMKILIIYKNNTFINYNK